MVKRESFTMRGILRAPRAGNDADDSCSCNTAATTVEEYEDNFSCTNAVTGTEASNMEVRANLILRFLIMGYPSSLVVS
jgi:hypothetical protein